jgi:uncharacterized protein (DUF1778 family)
MPTQKPRLSITLTERQRDVLQAVATCGGSSMSSVVSDMIELSMPVLERLAVSLQQLKKATQVDQGKLVQALDQAQTALEPLAAGAAEQFEMYMVQFDEATGRKDACGAGAFRPVAEAAAPPTNRGVTPTSGKAGKSLLSKRKKGFLS